MQPDVLVKGADWPADQIVGRDTVEARGGRVVRIAVEAGLLDQRARREDTSALGIKSQAPNPKLQPLPTTKSQSKLPTPNSQTRGPIAAILRGSRVGIWRFGGSFGTWEWLELGIWSLGFDADTIMSSGRHRNPLHDHLHLQFADAPRASEDGRRPPRDRLARASITGLTPSAKAMYAAASAARGPYPAGRPDRQRCRADHVGRAVLFRRARRAVGRRSRARRSCPSPRTKSIPTAVWRRTSTSPRPEPARCTRWRRPAPARLIVASAAALLPRVSAPGRLGAVSLTLTPGQDISPIDLGDLLAAAGYTRQDPVDESGEFCVRGGVVDFYPAGANQPLRLEFIGDTIESIRSYDPVDAALDRRARPGRDRAAAGADRHRSRQRGPGSFRDDLRLPLGSASVPIVLVSEPDEVQAHGREADRADRRPATRKRSAKGSRRAAAARS